MDGDVERESLNGDSRCVPPTFSATSPLVIWTTRRSSAPMWCLMSRRKRGQHAVPFAAIAAGRSTVDTFAVLRTFRVAARPSGCISTPGASSVAIDAAGGASFASASPIWSLCWLLHASAPSRAASGAPCSEDVVVMETAHDRQGDHGLCALAGSCMYLLFPIRHAPRRDERRS